MGFKLFLVQMSGFFFDDLEMFAEDRMLSDLNKIYPLILIMFKDFSE